MEIKGKVIQVMGVETFNTKKGPQSKQGFVLETDGKYPKKVHVVLFGDERINKYDLQEGLTVTAHVEAESREHNGRWYTELRAWKVTWEAQAMRNWTAEK